MLLSKNIHHLTASNQVVSRYIALSLCLLTMLLFSSCARMGNPDGGWYDETPPKVVSTSPQDGQTNISSKKIKINFDEFIKIDNASEKVIVSPPQLEPPEIKATGKSIEVKLIDSLKANTTYTIDFSDAITDNNEGNPLGNYTYSFSTGETIDTMEVSGYVVAAENLEPVKGILVGLYADQADSAFQKLPMLRVSRTDSRGHFVIKGVKQGSYRVYALQDINGDYRYSQKSEMVGFDKNVITTSAKPDIRQDTIWRDSLHIESIKRVGYTHFLPDDVTLRAFTAVVTNRYFQSATRQNANHFTINFSYGNDSLPKIKGLNFQEKDAFVVIPNLQKDTITYWLKDTTLINQDTLRMQVSYLMTDSLGKLEQKTDTLEVLSKISYERRQKLEKQAFDKWQKEQEKAKKKGDPYETTMPPTPLAMNVQVRTEWNPNKNIPIHFDSPINKIDTAKIHLYTKIDTLWYKANYQLLPIARRNSQGKYIRSDSLRYGMDYELIGEWKPGQEYSLEMDSVAFEDIYGAVTKKLKQGFKVKSLDQFSTLLVTLSGMQGKSCVVQLLDKSDHVVQEVLAEDQQAEFYYLTPDTYYMRLFVDNNHNGVWDTGDYDQQLEPEPVYYYPGKIECKAKWDVTESWNPTAVPLYQQKPRAITKQKADRQRTIKRRNAERARQMGIDYVTNNL